MTNHLILSDLHNEFSLFKPDVEECSVDVVILAGDIDKGSKGIYWARSQWPDKDWTSPDLLDVFQVPFCNCSNIIGLS